MNLGANPMSFTSSSASWKSGGGDCVSDQFPAGLRVLVVDDDPTCLRILEKMLRNCLYEVTKCSRAEAALNLLRDNKDGFDIVISDVHMPDMDGFKLLEHVGLEMDLPVIMMSADDSKNVVMKGVTHGACDYLIKPVRMEALKNIWQHVVRKKKHEWKEKDPEQSGSMEDGDRHQKLSEDVDYSSSANEGNWKSSKKRKDEEDDTDERDDTSALKKPRVVWSVELHQQFVTAVNHLGIDKAVPKKILELMNVPGLTRENVASHLQKYRLYLRRLSGQHQNGLGSSFMAPQDASFGPMTSLNGLDLQALASSGQLPPQSLATIQAAALGRATTTKPPMSLPLVDQRNIFSFESPKIHFMDGHHQQQQPHNNCTKQTNLLHGIPTNMHVHSQSRPHILNEAGAGGGHILNLTSSVGRPVLSQAIPSSVVARNGIDSSIHRPTYTSLSQPASVVDFSRNQPLNAFSLGSDSDVKGSLGFVPTYDVLSELNQNRTDDWGLQTVGSTFEAPHQHSNVVAPSVLVQPGFSNVQKSGPVRIPSGNFNTTNIGQQIPAALSDNSLTSLSDNVLRMKAERLPDMGFQNSLFPDQFGQEDLMSALLKQQEGVVPVENEFGFDGYHLDNLPV